MEHRPFYRSQFDEFEDWEEQEHQKRDQFHGDEGGKQRRNLGMDLKNLSMIRSIQDKQKSKLKDQGIGHSKKRKTDPFKNDSGS